MNMLADSESGENWLPGRNSCLLAVSSQSRRVRNLPGVSFKRVLIPLMRALPAWLKHLLKTTPPKPTILGVRISKYEYWRDTDIQSIASSKEFLKNKNKKNVDRIYKDFTLLLPQREKREKIWFTGEGLRTWNLRDFGLKPGSSTKSHPYHFWGPKSPCVIYLSIKNKAIRMLNKISSLLLPWQIYFYNNLEG